MRSTINRVSRRFEAVVSSAVAPRRCRRLVGAMAVVLSLAVAGDLPAVDLGACMEDRCGPQNCTANDVNLVLVGLGIQDDGCVSPNDTVDIFLRAVADTTTGQTRYDVSMWFAVDGDPNDDGARSGQCAVEILTPAATTLAGAPTCYTPTNPGGVEFNCGEGPFLNADGDLCGDITKGNSLPDCGQEDDITDPTDGPCTLPDGVGDSTVMDFADAITFPCTDTYDPAASPPDGFVDLPYCVTWHNQSDATDCDFPGTPICPSQKSKCTCETGTGAATNIPAPQLALSCSCAPDPVPGGSSATCTVTYTNPDTSPACDYDLNTIERFRCGTAAFVRFDTDYDELNGSITSISTAGTGGGGSAGTTGGLIRWLPDSRYDTPAVVGPGDSGSLTFVYTPNAGVSGQMTLPVTTAWSDSSGFSPNVLQAAAATTCTINLSPTWALVAEVAAERTADGVVVSWETAAEAATVGFHIERFDPATGGWLRANERLLPAAGHVPGGRYRFVDADAPDSRQLSYRLVEVEAAGGSRRHGPFDVVVGRTAERTTALEGFEAHAKAPSPRFADRAAGRAKVADVAPAKRSGAAKILVREAGLYGVPAEELAAALGISIRQVERSIVRGRFQLSAGGLPVAWTPSTDRTRLLFYGEPPTDEASPENVYWIEPGPGLLMATGSLSRPSSPAFPDDQTFTDTVAFEQNLFPMISVATDPSADFWTWKGLLAGDPTYGSAAFDFDLDGVVDANAEAVLALRMWSLAGDPESPNHRALVSLNGAPIADEAWDGSGISTLELAAPQSLLRSGANLLEVEALAGNFFVDAVAVTYERESRAAGDRLMVPAGDEAVVGVAGFTAPEIAVYELADPRMPVRIQPASIEPGDAGDWVVTFRRSAADAPYLVIAEPAVRGDAAVVADAVSDLRRSGNRGEYLVIAPRELEEAADSLADYRTSRGLESQVVLLDDVMDEFNHGLSSPLAIRSFLEYAHRHWALAPRWVVLLGKGTFDYHDRFGAGDNLVPPLLAPSAQGLVPADLRLGDVEGGDGLPEIAVGRIPVVDGGEVDAYLAKVMAYESEGGDWRSRVLMAADNADIAGDFPASSEVLASRLPAGAVVERVYLGQPYLPWEARDRLVAAVNDGLAVLNYVGHGGSDRLAAEGILTVDDIAVMVNGARLPVVTTFTCYIALFDYPGFSSLGEEMVLHPGGGAAAVFGPTGLSSNQQAVALGEELMSALAGGHDRLGDAVLQAARAYVEGGGIHGYVDVYALLGDPALEGP